jgi:hypothetical protein
MAEERETREQEEQEREATSEATSELSQSRRQQYDMVRALHDAAQVVQEQLVDPVVVLFADSKDDQWMGEAEFEHVLCAVQKNLVPKKMVLRPATADAVGWSLDGQGFAKEFRYSRARRVSALTEDAVLCLAEQAIAASHHRTKQRSLARIAAMRKVCAEHAEAIRELAQRSVECVVCTEVIDKENVGVRMVKKEERVIANGHEVVMRENHSRYGVCIKLGCDADAEDSLVQLGLLEELPVLRARLEEAILNRKKRSDALRDALRTAFAKELLEAKAKSLAKTAEGTTEGGR